MLWLKALFTFGYDPLFHIKLVLKLVILDAKKCATKSLDVIVYLSAFKMVFLADSYYSKFNPACVSPNGL